MTGGGGDGSHVPTCVSSPTPHGQTPARQAVMSLPGQRGGPGWEDAESMV